MGGGGLRALFLGDSIHYGTYTVIQCSVTPEPEVNALRSPVAPMPHTPI